MATNLLWQLSSSINIVGVNLDFEDLFFLDFEGLRPCLVPKKFCKIFQISCHIESLDTCMKY